MNQTQIDTAYQKARDLHNRIERISYQFAHLTQWSGANPKHEPEQMENRKIFTAMGEIERGLVEIETQMKISEIV